MLSYDILNNIVIIRNHIIYTGISQMYLQIKNL